MNVSTVSKWAKHQSNYVYMKISNDEFCSCNSRDYEMPSFYNEKSQKLLNHLEIKTKSPRILNKTNFASKVLPISPKRVHNYKTFKFMVLGAANVGKTSLIERFIHGQFTDDHLPTIADTYETGIFLNIGKELKQFDMELNDFCGSLKDDFPETYVDTILQSDGFIIVYSKDEPESLAKVVEMVADINILKEAPVVMILENKCDLKKNISTNIRTKFQIVNARHMEVSAKSDLGVDDAIKTLVYDLEDIEDNSTLDKKPLMSSVLDKFFKANGTLENRYENLN